MHTAAFCRAKREGGRARAVNATSCSTCMKFRSKNVPLRRVDIGTYSFRNAAVIDLCENASFKEHLKLFVFIGVEKPTIPKEHKHVEQDEQRTLAESGRDAMFICKGRNCERLFLSCISPLSTCLRNSQQRRKQIQRHRTCMF